MLNHFECGKEKKHKKLVESNNSSPKRASLCSCGKKYVLFKTKYL